MTEKTREPLKAVKPFKIDPRFEHEVSKESGGETLKLCYQCGTCTSSCPVSRFSYSYRPRTILKMAQLGMQREIFSDGALWLCAACFTCNDRCPQKVEVAGIIRAIRNLAVREGPIPPVFKELASNVLETGYAYKISGLRQEKRKEIGLPQLPKVDLESINRFAEVSGLLKLIKSKENVQGV